MITLIIIGSIITIVALITWRIIYKLTRPYRGEDNNGNRGLF